MKLATFAGKVTEFKGGLLAIGRYADGEPSAAEKAVDAALGGALTKATERLFFKAGARQTVALDVLGGQLGVQRVLLMGLGKKAECTSAILRDFAALAMDDAFAQRLDRVGIQAPSSTDAEAVASGLILGGYRWNALKTEDKDVPWHTVTEGTIIADGDIAAAVAHGTVVADAVNAARTLVHEPPEVCTPERLASFALGLAEDPLVDIVVLDRAEIVSRGMGGLVAVSQGAEREPRFIHLSYTPASGRTEGAIAFVGKGITFDSGGLSIKPSKGQVDMYMDMAGAGAVLGAMQAIVALKPDVPVHAIVSACENMPGGNSYRVSDILTMYSGKTVEVLNTDAEGRLVLADALHYATMLKPSCVIDLATLTGACLVGLGQFYAASYSDDEPLAERIAAAAKTADERIWRMPLDPKLADSLKSKRADITNLGGQWGGSITAAQFLQNFKGDIPWTHLDIAGPAMADAKDGYICHGGTGFAVMTLVAFVEASV